MLNKITETILSIHFSIPDIIDGIAKGFNKEYLSEYKNKYNLSIGFTNNGINMEFNLHKDILINEYILFINIQNLNSTNNDIIKEFILSFLNTLKTPFKNEIKEITIYIPKISYYKEFHDIIHTYIKDTNIILNESKYLNSIN